MIGKLSKEDVFAVVHPSFEDWRLDGNGFPIIEKVNADAIDWENLFVRSIQNLSPSKDNSSALVTMFRYDKYLRRLWDSPLKKVATLQSCAAVATPDFSLYPGMNINDIRHNIYKNRYLGRLWQTYGCTVLPTIGWATPETYDLCFSAVEPGTPVVISTLGCTGREESLELFIRGFNEMKARLSPPIIVVIGKIPAGVYGTFVNFKYTETFEQQHSQMKFDFMSAVFEKTDATGEKNCCYS